MRLSGCYDHRSDENVSFCSGTKARCSSDCLHSGDNNENQKRGKSFGAIAYSRKDGAYGYSYGWERRKKAEGVALKNCKDHGDHCKVAVWFYNQCGAVAADGKKVGVGLGETKTAAGQDALKNCSKFGKKNCEIKTAICSF